MGRLEGTLNEATSAEVGRVRQFLERHRNPNIVMHSVETQIKAAEEGLLYKIEEHGGEIVAAAMVMPVGNTAFHEMGNCLVDKRWRGFGLQKLLILCRVAGLTAAEDPSQRVVVGVDPRHNPISLNNIKALGFRLLDHIPLDLLEPCKNCEKHSSLPDGRQCCCDFFYLPEEEHRKRVQEFLLLERQLLLKTSAGEEAIVHFKTRTATDPRRRRVLEDFAVGRSWGEQSC